PQPEVHHADGAGEVVERGRPSLIFGAALAVAHARTLGRGVAHRHATADRWQRPLRPPYRLELRAASRPADEVPDEDQESAPGDDRAERSHPAGNRVGV